MEIPAASMTEKAALGQGYDVDREEFVGRCVRGEVDFAGAQESTLSFSRSLDQSSMARELGFEANAKARYGLFSGSLAARFASESSSSEYSDVTVYSHTINLRNAVLRFPGIPEGLTPEGRAAKGSLEGPFVGDNWKPTCGNEFVSQITLGAKLLVSVRIEFSSRHEKQTFSGSFSFSGPPVDVKASLQAASQRFGKRAALSIQAYQLGGDVRRLATIFGGGGGQAPILTASLSNPDAVLAALDAVVAYGMNDFAPQVDPAIPLDSPIGPANLAYLTSPWQELGLFAPPPIIEAGVTEARRLLNEEFETHAGYQRRISRLLNGPIRLSPRQLERFQAMQRIVAADLARIQDAAIICYSDFLAAPATVAATVAQLTRLTPEELDIEPESFAQWWDMKDLPETLLADKATVEGIASLLIPKFVDFESIEDKGLALQQQLPAIAAEDGSLVLSEDQRDWLRSPVWSVMAEANIREMQILHSVSGLGPLRWLTKLEKLLVTEPVRDLAPLATLTALHEVDVTGAVSDLGPLAGLSNLARLDVSANQGAIRDLSPLSGLANLRSVRLDRAGIVDVSPAAEMLALEKLSLPGSPVATVAPLVGLEALTEIAFGSTRVATGGTKLLSGRPEFANPFVNADRIEVVDDSGTTAIWIRRDDSNLFDTVSRDPATGIEVAGLGAFVGVGRQDFGTAVFKFVNLFHRRAGQLLVMLGSVSPDGQQAGGDDGSLTQVFPETTPDTTDVTGAGLGPSWTARPA